MLRPAARIYIQVRETGEIIECEDFQMVDVNLSMQSTSMATIKLANAADRWYTFNSASTRHQTDLGQYLKTIYGQKKFRDINLKLGDLAFQASRLPNGAMRDKDIMQLATLQQVLMFDLMYRVWIDFRGRDDLFDLDTPLIPRRSANQKERWYAGFTGVITDVREFYAPGKDSSITLMCKDFRRLFETSLAVTDKGYFSRIDTSAQLSASLQPFSNTFSDFVDGAGILRFLAQQVDSTFHAPDGSGIYKGLHFWNFPGFQNGQDSSDVKQLGKLIVERNYNGYDPTRIPGGYGNQSLDVSYTSKGDKLIDPKLLTNLDKKRAVKGDLMKFIDSSFQDERYLTSNIGIDVMINAGNAVNTTNPYQQLIKNTFNFESQRIPANTILGAIANLTGYDIFFDAKGNMIYQKSRYDDFPNPQTDPSQNDYDNGVQSTGIVFVDEAGATTVPLSNGFSALVGAEDTVGQFVPNSPLALQFHGRNYIIGDESIIDWDISQSEEDIVTNIIAPQQINNLASVDQFLQSLQATGISTNPDLNRRFGNRFEEAPPITSEAFNSLDILNTYAEGILNKHNAGFDTLNLRLNMRPDLQMGRTIYLAERRKLYYITKIQHRVIHGQEFVTAVSGKYGHHPLSPIGDPFRRLFEGLVFAPAGTTDFKQLQQQLDKIYAAVRNPSGQ